MTPDPQSVSRRRALAGLIALAASAGIGGCASAGTLASTRRSGDLRGLAEIPREFRGVWVATVDNIDWPSKPGLSPERQRAEMVRILDAARKARLNAVILQVRAMADAIYPSRLEPSSAFLTGRMGEPLGGTGEPGRDPLREWIDAAHARGLELHAWVNPFRVDHPKAVGTPSATHVTRSKPELVRPYGPYKWLDPGDPASRTLALAVVDDVIRRYPVDGIHMDDYFYPYPRDGVAFPDDATYKRYGAGEARGDWRRANIDTFVRTLHEHVRLTRPDMLVGVSPFGIWKPGHPAGIVGFDPVEGLYADSKRWLDQGWLDYLAPQLYWPIESKGQAFEPLLKWWSEQNRATPHKGRHLWPGLYLTRIQQSGSAEASWDAEQIRRQVALVQQESGATGSILFSAVGLVENRRGVADLLERTVFAHDAVVPESPWVRTPVPGYPIVRGRIYPERVEVSLAAGDGPSVRRWVLRSADGMVRVVPGSEASTTLFSPLPIWVTPIGASGATGPTVVLERRAE